MKIVYTPRKILKQLTIFIKVSIIIVAILFLLSTILLTLQTWQYSNFSWWLWLLLVIIYTAPLALLYYVYSTIEDVINLPENISYFKEHLVQKWQQRKKRLVQRQKFYRIWWRRGNFIYRLYNTFSMVSSVLFVFSGAYFVYYLIAIIASLALTTTNMIVSLICYFFIN